MHIYKADGESGKNAELPCARHRFGPVGDIQLAIDIGCVSLDGTPRHDELLGDLLIGLAQGNQVENFQLAPA